ncbi:hypothetical protein [Nocardia sp. NPDC051463]|uniref:hypothetical protein n=1 Tax=Nocardia sp. NPDC051463 TaxID=3154845 RepID=UPI00344C25B9
MRSIDTSFAAAAGGVALSQKNIRFGDHTRPSKHGFRTGLPIGCGVALVAAAITATIPYCPHSPPTPKVTSRARGEC